MRPRDTKVSGRAKDKANVSLVYGFILQTTLSYWSPVQNELKQRTLGKENRRCISILDHDENSLWPWAKSLNFSGFRFSLRSCTKGDTYGYWFGAPRTPGRFCYYLLREQIYQFGWSQHSSWTESLVLNGQGPQEVTAVHWPLAQRAMSSCHCSVIIPGTSHPNPNAIPTSCQVWAWFC